MRALLAASVIALSLVPAGAGADSGVRSDDEVRRATWAGLILVINADKELRACGLCSTAASSMGTDALIWSGAVRRRAASSPAGTQGRAAAVGAFTEFYSAASLAPSSSSGYSVHARHAAVLAWRAVTQLGLPRAAFTALIVSAGCPSWRTAIPAGTGRYC